MLSSSKSQEVYLQGPSGQTAVIGVFPSPLPVHAFIFVAQSSASPLFSFSCWSIFIEFLLTRALALSARQFVRPRVCGYPRTRRVYTIYPVNYESVHTLFSFLLFFLSHFYFPASGQAVVTGVVPSPPRFLPSIFIAHRVQQSRCSSIFIECC